MSQRQNKRHPMSAMRKLMWAMIVVVVIAGGLGTGAFMYVYSQVKQFDQVFADGIFVEETYIGGLTKEEAKAQVIQTLEKKDGTKSITFYGKEKEWVIPYTEFGGGYNVDEVLDQAFQVGHQGNILQRFQAFTATPIEKTIFDLTYSYNKETVHKVVEKYADQFYIAPKDATMIRKDRKFIITPEKQGQQLDIQATTEKFYMLCDAQKEGKVEAIVTPIPAKLTASYFKEIQNPIASFYTSYNNADPNRNDNLMVGSSKINVMIEPGGTFSLAKHLEPITYNNGYRSSKVIVNGKLVDGIGGGVCQIASTLYNSVLLTDLDVTMRQNHSLPVAYIPLGRDATYASNAIDFQFKNPTQYPVYIESYCENNRLYVNIFGHKSLKPEYEIKFESVVSEVIPAPPTQYIDDAELIKGEKLQELTPLDGKKVKLYKYMYKDGKLIDKVLENNSYYRPRAGVVHVGTKEVGTSQVFHPDTQPKPEKEEMKENNIDETLDVLDDGSKIHLYEEQT